MSAQPVDVLAVLAEGVDFVDGFVGDESQEGIDELLAGLRAAHAAVAELLAADHEYNLALVALRALNRQIAERGWLEVEADALRDAGARFVRAQERRLCAMESFSVGEGQPL